MVEIIPALLPQDENELEEQDLALPPRVYCHLDIVEKDVWVPIMRPFEVHLMVKNPDDSVKKWIDRGAKRVIAHKFSDYSIGFRNEVELGLALKIDTKFEDVEKELSEVDFVHLMSIAEIGEQGHELDNKIFDRIKEFKSLHPELDASVDGGVDLGNAPQLIEAGADRLIVGSAIIESADPEEIYEDFIRIAQHVN